MAGRPSATGSLKQIEVLYRLGAVGGWTDGQLLGRFIEGPSEDAESAFAALVERHGPMVHRLCRQILGDPDDADDALQATFLVLARRARSIRSSDSVAGWLHGTATRIARRARADAARGRRLERQAADRTARIADESITPEPWTELHEELARLPERFRLPIVLFHLEGLTYQQAAQRIGCPIRTVQSRLVRGRARLRARLIRRGLGPTAAGLVAALTSDVGAAGVSYARSHTTARAAILYKAGETSAASIPTSVAALVQGALNAMIREKLSSAAAAVLIGCVACGMIARARPDPPDPGSDRPSASTVEGPDGRYRVTMSDGTTIEVIGVSTHPSGPTSWWAPDGSPLDEAPADPGPAFPIDLPGGVVREILLRVLKGSDEATVRWSSLPELRWGVAASKDGRRIPGMEMLVAGFPQDKTTCAIRVDVAAGPWKTEESHDGSGGFSTTRDELKCYFGKARPHRGGTAIAVANNIVGRDSRVVALGRDNRLYTPTYSSGGGGAILSLLDVEFDLPPDQVASYVVQSRLFENAEIEGISLRPHSAGR